MKPSISWEHLKNKLIKTRTEKGHFFHNVPFFIKKLTSDFFKSSSQLPVKKVVLIQIKISGSNKKNIQSL